MRQARAGAGLAGALLALTACTSTVSGAASPVPGGTGDASGGGHAGTTTAACEWVAARSGNPYAVEVAPPDDEVPAEGTAALRMTTSLGELVLTLDRAGAPCAAASMVHLAGLGFFDGSACHREVDSAGLQVLQCGDPTGTGAGGPTYAFPTEVDGSETYPRGTIAMANSGQGLDGSQFFLVWGDSELPPDYTVVGTVDDAGLAVLDVVAANGNDGSLDPSPGGGAPTVPVTVTAMTPVG
ncbi:peptidyl-prolyl cis-trans isomerase B (cyclophilin B) [Geodermatophilus normandii]|uniref:Peptidyl-prolyl cis-trans isomerase B (Cyclophilin B) n=1 Tax=Geodermatophilus normandii TaxID=1137989 RepID=A0A317QNR2_9ACTN|nr:peptidylprolyl isomerase [Geodermatophilus normandii]PWW24594.1 peptidyl-prolyl cis-trans isomerase B (cyclophilin B) [Geodermatophilus normandii]